MVVILSCIRLKIASDVQNEKHESIEEKIKIDQDTYGVVGYLMML